MSALLLHSQLNTWLQWVGQRQPQDKTRNVYAWGLGAPYIRELTVIYNPVAIEDSNWIKTHLPYIYIYILICLWFHKRDICCHAQGLSESSHCSRVTPYRDIDLGQHCSDTGLLLDGTKPIFCTNIDLSSEKSSDIHSMAIPQEIPHSVINA